MEITAMLADHVDAANGKLYIHGGAWNIYMVKQVPIQLPPLGIAIAIAIPWTATNQMHKFDVQLLDEDKGVVPLGEHQRDDGEMEGIAMVEGQFNVGRPPNVPAGDDQVITIPVNINHLRIETGGRYTFVIRIDGHREARLSFRVKVADPTGMVG
jgi:hypothetical protein